MNIIWGFAPFIVYIALVRTVSIEAGLWGAFLLALVALARDIGHGRAPKILEIGNFTLFGALLAYGAVTGIAWNVGGQRLVVDLGLFVIVAFSILIGRPFTLQYAREGVPEEVRASPLFLRANRTISAAWGLAFALLAGLDLTLDRASVSLDLFAGLTLAVLAVAGWFTYWYPRQLRRNSSA